MLCKECTFGQKCLALSRLYQGRALIQIAYRALTGSNLRYLSSYNILTSFAFLSSSKTKRTSTSCQSLSPPATYTKGFFKMPIDAKTKIKPEASSTRCFQLFTICTRKKSRTGTSNHKISSAKILVTRPMSSLQISASQQNLKTRRN